MQVYTGARPACADFVIRNLEKLGKTSQKSTPLVLDFNKSKPSSEGSRGKEVALRERQCSRASMWHYYMELPNSRI